MSPHKTRVIDRALHWISAVAIVFLLFDIGFKVFTQDYRVKSVIEHKQDAIEVHLLVASLLFAVLMMRIVWYRFFLDRKYWLAYESTKQKVLVRLAHFSMYSALALLVISGLLMVFNYEHPLSIFGVVELSTANIEPELFHRAYQWHLYLEGLIYCLILVHLFGVMYYRRYK